MNREILRLAIPNIISNVSVPMLSTVDTVLMGQLSGIHLGAIGIGSMIFNFLYWNFVFLRMGTTGLTAQAFGRQDEKEIAISLGRALLTALGMGILMILCQYPLWQAGKILMNVSSEHAPLVESYFRLRLMAAPATLCLYALLGWYFGMQNAIYPLVVTIILNLINIGVSAWLVLGLGMEVRGVALGTVIAQYLGLGIALILLWHRYRSIIFQMVFPALLVRDEIIAFFRLNKDIFLRTLCLSFVFAFFYSQSSASGEMVLASTTILLQFLNWMSYGIDGFAFAAESLTGKYLGAGNDRMLTRTIRYSFYWGGGLALLFSLAYWTLEEPLLALFSSDPEIIRFSSGFFGWIIILPLIGFGSYIWDGIFVGLTAARSMRNSMFLSFAVYFLLYFTMRNGLGPHALWLSLLVFLAARAFFQSMLYFRYGKNLA